SAAIFLRRNWSIAFRLAVAMSQAPGLSGVPSFGQRSRAATRASCARSSAKPTSRVMRASPAINRGDSMRKTASIWRWVSAAVIAADQTHATDRCKPGHERSALAFQLLAAGELGLARGVGRRGASLDLAGAVVVANHH